MSVTVNVEIIQTPWLESQRPWPFKKIMDPSRTELLDKIKAQGDVVRKLKEQKAEKSMVRFYANCVLGKFF